MYCVEAPKTAAECRTVLARLKARGLVSEYNVVFRRLCMLSGNAMSDLGDPLVADFYAMLAAYEQLLSEKNGRNQPASRTRQ